MISRDVLEKFPIFSGLDPALLNEVAKLGTKRAYRAGEVCIDEGAPAHFLYLLEHGKVVLERNLPGGFHGVADVHTLQDKQMFGWSAIVEPAVHTASVRCIEDSEVIQINGKDLQAVLDRGGAASYQFMKRLATVIALRLIDTSNAMMREMADFSAYRSM